jgi:hypothetical protein
MADHGSTKGALKIKEFKYPTKTYTYFSNKEKEKIKCISGKQICLCKCLLGSWKQEEFPFDLSIVKR